MSGYTAEQAQQIDWHSRWERYGIPVRFWDFGIADMPSRSENEAACKAAGDMVDTWRERRPPRPDKGEPPQLPDNRSLLGKGLILIGSAGVGKTRLACAAATDIARTYNTAALYMPVTEYFSLGRKIQDEPLEVQDRLREKRARVEATPLLIWDDMGKEYAAASGYNGAEVYRILRKRFDHMRPTIITTNVPLAQWNERYEGAMFSFLHEAFDAAVIRGKDQRRAGK